MILGLEGEDPATVDTDLADARVAACKEHGKLTLAGRHVIAFAPSEDLVLHRRKSLPAHPNGMTFTAYDERGQELRSRTYYSVGGGFVVDDDRGRRRPGRRRHHVGAVPVRDGGRAARHLRPRGSADQ